MEKLKEFKVTSWAIDNKTSIYILTIIITLFGIVAYYNLQKEKFPDIVIPTIYVGTVYPGTSPTDMENLVTRPIEKNLKSLSGVKKINSSSIQDFSSIAVEFNTDVDVADAKQRVKDAVDKSRSELPTDLPQEPNVMDINFSEIPIMFVNISGNYSLAKLKEYAEQLQDRIEGMKEITRVDLIGALDREVQVNVDMYKMQAAKVTFNDIARAIQSENMTISGGNVEVGAMQRAIRIVGQYEDPNKIGNIIIRSVPGQPIYLRDIAEVDFTYKERESYARLDNKPVITLSVVKRSGENLIEASDQVREIVEEMEGNVFPSDLEIVITNDMSLQTRASLNDLINSIIIGFILVTLVLMFFMGTTNALFVGLSVPISMFLAFLVMPALGFSLNMIVLFAFLLALGIVVDDAIVVIENTHRIFHTTHYSIGRSAKYAAGEVFLPVLAGTLTTLAPFFPLAFWPGIVGNFMFYMPVTLIITLFASLLVAFIINPVFAVSFMRKDDGDGRRKMKLFRNTLIVLGVIALLFYLGSNVGMGNLTVFIALVVVLNKYVFTGWIKYFQDRTLPAFKNRYERTLEWMLLGSRPYLMLGAIVALLVFSIIITAIRSPQVVFFPQGDPNYIYAYINMPVGTDVETTDSIAKVIEKKTYNIVGQDNPDVESVIANVAVGAGEPMDFSRSTASNKAKITVAFVEFPFRTGPSTRTYLDKMREAVKGIPGAEITVEQEQNGPPVGKPISIEISGDDFKTLSKLSKQIERYLETQSGIQGIEDLRSDLQDQKPEITINIDRERANLLGVSTAQIATEIRTAVFGVEASKYKEGEDEYPIQIRYAEPYRKNIDALADLRITFREMSSGQIKQVPLSSVATVEYNNTYGGIKRKNLKRMVTLSSNVLSGYNPNEVVQNIKDAMAEYNMPQGYLVDMTGEQEQQEETMAFLSMAGVIAILLIFFILVLQFNSVSKPIIILTEIIFSIIGVLLGFAIFNMDISIVMTGVGIIALGGIVVKNGILLVEFADELKSRGLRTTHAVIQAGKTRLSPVLLTATATVLGLIPLALGMNINFFTLFTELDPDFYLGGESMNFWGPLAWTIIFGLTFATFLTLIIVPVMYMISYRWKVGLKRKGILPKGYKL